MEWHWRDIFFTLFCVIVWVAQFSQSHRELEIMVESWIIMLGATLCFCDCTSQKSNFTQIYLFDDIILFRNLVQLKFIITKGSHRAPGKSLWNPMAPQTTLLETLVYTITLLTTMYRRSLQCIKVNSCKIMYLYSHCYYCIVLSTVSVL
jgi:hypothetical protein